MDAVAPPPRRKWSWRSRAARGLLYQAIALLVIGLVIWFLAHNTQENLRVRGIRSGFDFLGAAAGFDIGESLIAFGPADSYARAIWVGVLNTLRVALLGILFTTVVGVLIGIGRFSRNALVRAFCYGYVELVRNVPLLLQLLMWYVLFVEVLPPPQAAWNLRRAPLSQQGRFGIPGSRVGRGTGWNARGSAGGTRGRLGVASLGEAAVRAHRRGSRPGMGACAGGARVRIRRRVYRRRAG